MAWRSCIDVLFCRRSIMTMSGLHTTRKTWLSPSRGGTKRCSSPSSLWSRWKRNSHSSSAVRCSTLGLVRLDEVRLVSVRVRVRARVRVRVSDEPQARLLSKRGGVVGADDGDGQGEDDLRDQRDDGRHCASRRGDGEVLAVADRSDGDEREPESARYRFEGLVPVEVGVDVGCTRVLHPRLLRVKDGAPGWG